MNKVWYCPNCGYEVGSRGRCHQCRERLVASALPELQAGDEDDDEVGYRLEEWTDRDRGRLITRLNEREILHRFEGDELVVAADDEERVDDLTAEIIADPRGDLSGLAGSDDADDGPAAGGDDEEWMGEALRKLVDAARRLRRDPTDMNADADVAEVSTAVFMADRFSDTDPETWAAVGRVTRRLLAALGADEALEDEIRDEAGILAVLLTPIVGDGTAGPTIEPGTEETVYELAEWLPEQRAQLGLLLEEAGIAYEWDDDDLIVPADREGEAEALFGRVGTVGGQDDDDDSDDGEARYHAIEELFAAADRLANSPSDEQRAADTSARIADAIGPPPIGFDEVHWFRIMTAARALAETIDADHDEQAIFDDATALRDLLRSVV
jgi:hypothetical protein